VDPSGSVSTFHASDNPDMHVHSDKLYASVMVTKTVLPDVHENVVLEEVCVKGAKAGSENGLVDAVAVRYVVNLEAAHTPWI
jgi:hypothetical protein